jgi:hypothetical protein
MKGRLREGPVNFSSSSGGLRKFGEGWTTSSIPRSSEKRRRRREEHVVAGIGQLDPPDPGGKRAL